MDETIDYYKIKESFIYDVNKLEPFKCMICKHVIINHNHNYCKKYYCNMNDSIEFYKHHDTFIKLLKNNKHL
jgi:hypothetical protein